MRDGETWETFSKKLEVKNKKMETSSSIPEKVDESPVEPAASFPLNETDLCVLGQTDEEFHFHDWEELREIIGLCLWVSC